VPSQQLEDRAPGRVTEKAQAGISVSVHERLGYTYQQRDAIGSTTAGVLAQAGPRAGPGRWGRGGLPSRTDQLGRRPSELAGLTNVQFRQADIFALPFDTQSSTTSSSVSSWSTCRGLYFHPESDAARAAIQCQVTLQREAGGNALIGRQLYPLIVEAGLGAVRVSPRMVYVDSSRPDLADGFTKRNVHRDDRRRS
jgi:hypothetical protein